ncbi:hypothetical protein [Mucilaginibacter aquariorum]|uniref:Nicotinate-nucleotide adenylyltransferase n=1 Tax=Mucilaginibacter aquariorum TaxID=2967225 RepID=A0ABT1T3H1_9SPHI|nr:hypothetical protein [Mucilaginibacter aquariorum]MCQ6959159.1 hypothetical protein [Mucilaginibacter aquariorum]
MKRLKLIASLSLILFSYASPTLGQINLPEVKIVATSYKYKYLNAVDNKELPQPVRMLERLAATYDVRKADFYEDAYDTYFVSFYIPDGSILASYDKDGKLLRTAEKFKNTKLPAAVREAVEKRFPQWAISKDTYLINYYSEGGAKKKYKLLLENGDKRMRVETNDIGEFN